MRGHKNVIRMAKPEHQHVHTNAELILVICRRLIPLVEPDVTAAGMQDAEDCVKEGVLLYGPEFGERALLMGKLHHILDDIREGDGQ